MRLNFAVALGALLLPGSMVINTKSVVGYNNKLKVSTPDMTLGINNQVNQGTEKASLKKMGGGKSKINPPNSHPSNPIHKQATEAQGLQSRPSSQHYPHLQRHPSRPPRRPRHPRRQILLTRIT